MKNRAFTLVELLVVVLIIGILAAIAVPQYQKAVLKANLHKGVSLVESLYQAQQAYFLAHGDFAHDFDSLDISVPINQSCVKTEITGMTLYTCDFGKIAINDDYTDVGYSIGDISYWHFFKDRDNGYATFEEGKRYCFANPNNKAAQSICQSMGGSLIGEYGIWKYYKLD